MRILMATLGFLMISNVPYPAWPKFSFRTLHGTLGIIALFSGLLALYFLPREFFVPVAVLDVTVGIVLAILRGVFEVPPPFEEPASRDDEEEDDPSSQEAARP